MSKNFKRTILAAAIVLLAAIGILSFALYPKLSNLKSEYVTADVIRDLDAYVVTHPGEWPKSWKDLGTGSNYSAYTTFHFDLSVDAVLQQPGLIYEAVTPTRGQYYTYPHAKSQLAKVLKKIQSTRGATKPKDATQAGSQ